MGILRKLLEPLQNERGQFNFQDFLDQFDFSNLGGGGGQQTGGVQRARGTGGAFPTGSGIFDILTTPTGPGPAREGTIGRGIRESRQSAAGAFQQRLPQLLQTLMGSLGFGGGGGFGLPTRESLLDPRLGDIGDVAAAQREQIGGQAAAQGRNIAATPFQRALSQVGTGEQRERQRATGDVDTLLAQLGQGQQGILLQLLQSILGGGLFG